MHAHRNADVAPTPRRANTPPPAGNVHGLGLVDALRIELRPEQLPWLAAEIDTVRYCLEDELEHSRARYDELPEAARKEHWQNARDAEEEIERRAYQLQALAMVGDQLPISAAATAATVAGPRSAAAVEPAPEDERPAEPIAVAGPAALMTILIGGAMRHAAEALGEAVRGPGLEVDHWTESGRGWGGGEVPRVTPAVAEKLRALAAAVHGLTDTYLHALEHQAYSFDPEYDPVYADELEVAARQAAHGSAGGGGAAAGNS
jgi:hypothetical protein